MTDNEILQALYLDMQEMKADMQEMKADMQEMKADMQEMKADMQEMKTEMQVMKADISELKSKVNSIEMTVENETNRNIKLIAEGHLDLSRKLDQALKVENEKEMLLIRVNVLENEVRKIKEHLNHIA